MKSNLDPNFLLLEEEQRILYKTRKLREEIIDEFIKNNGIPTNSRDVRVLNEVMNSLDDQVLTLVDRRLKHEENAVKSKESENLSRILELLDKKVYKGDNTIPVEKRIGNIEVPDDIVPGETDTEYTEIELEDILNYNKG